MRKKILVTGGAGFVGSHICEKLIENGQEVICMDNFFTGSRANVQHLLANPRFELMRGDVTQSMVVDVDEVYHLACPASPIHYQRNPVRTIKTAFVGTLHMLELCREVHAKLLIASTSEVYGDPQVHPQIETYWGHVNPLGPRSCYDEGKRSAESLALSFSEQYDVPVRIPRIFNTYGPRMHVDDGRVVSNFVIQALLGRPITVYGKGQQTRSFCFVSDLVNGLIRLMDSTLNVVPVNIGNPQETTILELAQLIIELTGSSSPIVYEELPEDDPTRRKPDISLARRELGWEPTVELRSGIGKTIKYFRDKLKDT